MPFVYGADERRRIKRLGAETAIGIIEGAICLSHSLAHLAERNLDGRVVRVGEYLHDLEAASAHERGAERNLGANACSRTSSDHDDSNAVRHVGRRSSGGIGWR